MAIHPNYYHLDICTGSGMLGLGIKTAIPQLRTVAYVERESYAAASLVARMEDQALDRAPIWDDVTTLSSPEFLEFLQLFRPLIVSGGYPCQPFSLAGKRLGEDDPRHLWPHIARFLEAHRPECCFFENVAGHLSLGFDAVVSDLERLGYRVAAGLFSAEEVGATHRRERLFILAVRKNGGLGELRESSGRNRQPDGSDASMAHAQDTDRRRELPTREPATDGRSGFDGDGQPLANSSPMLRGAIKRGESDGVLQRMADPESPIGRECLTRPRPQGGIATGGTGADLADAEQQPQCAQQQQKEGERKDGTEGDRPMSFNEGPDLADAREQGSQGSQRPGTSGERNRTQAPRSTPEFYLPLFAPGPGDTRAWSGILAHRPDLAPAIEPLVCRTPDGLAYRLDPDRLRLTGNGVVPLAAAYAFATLALALEREINQ